MATNTDFMVSELKGIEQAIIEKFGDDGLREKTAPASLTSAEQRVWQELAAIKEAMRHTTGGGGGTVDQTARDMAQAAQETASEKAKKIVQQEHIQDQTMYDYMQMEVPSVIELPAGTLHTTTVVNSDITEILGFTPSPQPGPNFSQISFKSVSGDFYVQYKVTTGRRPDLPCTISLFQKKPDGSFQEHNIYNGSVMGGGTINNQTIAQIDWLQFANYDMSFDIRNISMTIAQARELNLWKHITRGHVSQSVKDLSDARDDILGEVVSMRSTLQAKDVELESKITLYEKVTRSELEAMIADPELAQEGVIYKVDDGTSVLKMYTKDSNVIKQLGDTSYAPLTGTWAINPDHGYEATFTLNTPIALGNGLRFCFNCLFSVDYNGGSTYLCITKEVVVFDPNWWEYIQIGNPIEGYPIKWVSVILHMTDDNIDYITFSIDHTSNVINFNDISGSDIRVQAI